MTKRITYNATSRQYDLFVAVDGGAEQHIGEAATLGQGDVECNRYLIAYFLDTGTPERAAELVMANSFALA